MICIQLSIKQHTLSYYIYIATMAQSTPTLPPPAPGPPRVIGSGIRDDVSVLTMGEPSIRTSTISSMNQMIRSTNPLPRQIASDDAAIRIATKQSVTESQQHRIRNERMSKEYEREFQRAVSESKLLPSKEKKEEEDYEAEQLRIAYELSLKEEEKSTETKECEEEQLKMAYEQSLKVEQKDYNAEVDEDYEAEQLRIAYELSLKDDQGSSIDYQSMQQSGRHIGEDQMDEYLDEDEVHSVSKRVPEEGTSRRKVDKAEVEEDYEEAQLRMAYEQSLQEEHKSTSRKDEEEAQLKLAYEQSIQEEKKGKDDEEEQMRLAYELSLKQPDPQIDEEEQLRLAYEESRKHHYLNQEFTDKQFEDALLLAIEKSNEEAVNQPTSDEDLIEQALAESKAMEEAKKASEEDELAKALEQSAVLEENRKSHHEQNELATSSGIDLLEVVKTLSLKQQEEEALAEEEAIRRATEMSMRWT